jgi:hypothetical protein
VIEIRRNDAETTCSVCGRTLLLGERLLAYVAPDPDGAPVELRVCQLCTEQADQRGWLREGAEPPPAPPERPRGRGLRGLLSRRRTDGEPQPFELDCLPADPHETVEAGLELFNESAHKRTVSGIARTLGDPRVSVVRRSHRELVVTVAWDLSWYQYRVDMLGPQPVTLQRRGEEIDELEGRFRDWNALAEPDGSVALSAS